MSKYAPGITISTEYLPDMQDPRETISLVDLFAGPGGLGEGFEAYTGSPRFKIKLSVEKEKYAHETLTLRSFFRQFDSESVPDAYYRFLRGEVDRNALAESHPQEWASAERQVMHATLGNDLDQPKIDQRITAIAEQTGDRPSVLVGGPPCQAYSLVGRSRMKGIPGYDETKDHRHHLYEEYLRVITILWPSVFVMENVPGILTSKFANEPIFPKIVADLQSPGVSIGLRKGYRYRLYPCAGDGKPETFIDTVSGEGFVVRFDQLGVPQKRSRIIILGVRDDIQAMPTRPGRHTTAKVREVLSELPPVRSEISGRGERVQSWSDLVCWMTSPAHRNQINGNLRGEIHRFLSNGVDMHHGSGGRFVPGHYDTNLDSDLLQWLRDERIGGFCNHETRSHMGEDLGRYLFAACYGRIHRQSPTLAEFPEFLMPEHRNAAESKRSRALFADRFRVQLAETPSTTVTSHISKDGHYYIHYDPAQCRSLTVREAARLQTFPDNYFFCGPRTAQFAQVGNAVPAFGAMQIAGVVHRLLKDGGLI